MKQILQKILYLPRVLVLFLIKIYQKILSPDHSFWARNKNPHGYCKFTPTCSQYGYEVIKKKGILIGIPKTCWRIIRCNPCNPGGIDLP
ncbi:MAG: membrane protein insertion efficiency factor YidD [Candidatus Magasanikbacteria bacterium CG_4_10_14_0_2_um_filter_37_12]|uniref:Membrane protein insertion efficiency factor YidD n=1 Tax=Candidatus Magasanikbacteria bacterium CG_4_10_14_0_2_um_filter_37_12 TaxID=1974637 RepID=A0A2M7V968_9BACT|nr:MAG: membrane protein insertion efficiency factor YidD [Candidatus Magasanikbacteria bacterium CG_4_10_14_0_2_um_filter_37_12]